MSQPYPAIGHWFCHPGGPTFEIVAIDEEAQTIEIQQFDGTIDQIDADVVLAWQSPAGAITPMGMAYIPPPIETIKADAERRLQQSLDGCDLVDVEYETVLAERDASTLLCEVAENADLLVVGSRGLGGFKGLILGSVSARCANECPCPVAVVPTDWEDPGRDVHGVVSIGVDGSANADAAVQWADAWAPEKSLSKTRPRPIAVPCTPSFQFKGPVLRSA